MVIRINKSGYQVFRDRSGVTRSVHKRVVEKKMGGKVRAGYEIHHRDGDRTNNIPSNLTAVRKSIHRMLHR